VRYVLAALIQAALCTLAHADDARPAALAVAAASEAKPAATLKLSQSGHTSTSKIPDCDCATGGTCVCGDKCPCDQPTAFLDPAKGGLKNPAAAGLVDGQWVAPAGRRLATAAEMANPPAGAMWLLPDGREVPLSAGSCASGSCAGGSCASGSAGGCSSGQCGGTSSRGFFRRW